MPMVTREDGHKFAVAMLRAMEDRPDECSMFQDGRGTQDNVVLGYLKALRQEGNPDVDAGFAEVVTDFIASALDNGVARPEAYEPKVIAFPTQNAPSLRE